MQSHDRVNLECGGVSVPDSVSPRVSHNSSPMSRDPSEVRGFMRDMFVGATKGIADQDHWDNSVGAITDQEGELVIIVIQRSDISRVDGRSVTHANVVFFTCEDKSITNGVTLGKVENTGVNGILIGSRSSSNGSKDLSIGRFGWVPVVGGAKEHRETRISHVEA